MSGTQTRRRQRGGTLAQGTQFNSLHVNQHGGAVTPLYGAPVGYSGVLEGGLRESARLSQYDSFFNAASGMSDTVQVQKGGASRRQKQRTQKQRQKQRTQKQRQKQRTQKQRQKQRTQKQRQKQRTQKQRQKQKQKQRQKQGGGSRAELGYGNVGSSYMLLPSSVKTGGSDFSNPLLKH